MRLRNWSHRVKTRPMLPILVNETVYKKKKLKSAIFKSDRNVKCLIHSDILS